MRRNRRKGKISIYVIIGICFLFLFVVGGIYAQVSQTLFLTGTVRTTQKNKSVDVVLTNTGSIVEGQTRYRYNYTYTITNNTDQAISSWKVLVSNMPTSSTEIAEWNHEIFYNDIANGKIIFKSKEWNTTISAGASVTVNFSFIASELIDVNQLKITMYYGTITPDNPDEPDDTDKLTSIEINPTSATLKTGESIQLQAIKTPSNATDTLSWSSSDETIAKVSQDGKVTAISKGNVTIKVMSGSINATCNIVVETEQTDTPTESKIKIEFTTTHYWANSIQFKIIINNNMDSSINNYSFTVGMPQGSQYMIWSGNCSNSGNTITCNNSITSGGTYEIYGQVDIPEGYNTEEYLKPIITGIQG